MPRLTLRTLLAYLDDTLDARQARALGQKVAESESARELIDRIKRVTRRRGLHTPVPGGPDDVVSDPNTVAEYLSNTLDSEQVAELEETCLKSDVHLAEVAACHQILTLLLTEPVRVPPTANQRMYKLVEAPASIPDRKPGKAVPVGGMPIRTADKTEADDTDAALLLGMRRYSESGTGRWGLLGAVAALSLLLAVAALMALRHRPPEPPPTHRDPVSYAAVTPPAISPAAPTKLPTANTAEVAPEPRPVNPETPPGAVDQKAGPEKLLVAEVPAPRPDREKVGRVESPNVLVVARPPDGAAWLRLSPDSDPTVTTGDTVVCLPGYKADVRLDSGVGVHLWGNVPELLPDRLLDARVRFHVPPKKAEGGEEFDADLTLLAGRVYLSTRKPGGARVRVRAASEVWDLTLPNDQTDVLVELVTAFVPGTPYAREGGEGPRVDVRAVVVKGTAGLKAPQRPKEFPQLAMHTLLAWDNKGGRLSGPDPVTADAMPRISKFFLVESAQGKAVQAALTDLATRLKERDGIKLLLAERLTEEPDPAGGRAVPVRIACYAMAAILAEDPTGNGLKLLIDRLNEQTRPFARQAATTALAYWLAQAPGNTALLHGQLVTEARVSEEDADLILRMLRGYLPAGKPNPEDMDRLVGYLAHPSVAVRELTLWNLLTFVDPEAIGAGLYTDVGETGERYDKFVRAWRNRAEEIKKRGEVAPKPKPK
jgi:hypothetical protein